MKILLTIHHELDVDAGAAGVTVRLAEAYRQEGHDASVLSFSDLPARWPARAKALAFPSLVARRVQQLTSQDALDVVDASTGDAWLHGTIRRRNGARPTIIATRGHGLEHTLDLQVRARARTGGTSLSWHYPVYGGGYRLWEVARSMRVADVTLLLNAEDRAYAVGQLGIPARDVLVVRNGIPHHFIGRPAPAGAEAGLRIAVIGSYIDRKGITFTAEALNELLPEHPDWTVTFLGTGCAPEQVLAHYDAAVRPQLTVRSSYDNRDLPALLGDQQIHLFPTLLEGGPLALLESMACGLAPVVSRIPGPTEVVSDGVNGLLVPPGDSAAIVHALEALAADPSRLLTLRNAAHATAQSYGWDEIASEQLTVYADRLAAVRR